MRKIYLYLSEAAKACLSILMGGLLFIKIDHSVAHIPDAEGGIGRFDYYYSIYDKLVRENLQFLVYIALAVTAASVAVSIAACLVKDSRKVRIASHIVFGVSAVFFFALLFYAMQIRYGY